MLMIAPILLVVISLGVLFMLFARGQDQFLE
ncbi:cytochrome bd oxidase small subunit CydS [Paenibacillus gyeongsangnamensis]